MKKYTGQGNEEVTMQPIKNVIDSFLTRAIARFTIFIIDIEF
jgi:DUF2075 family protein